MTIHRVRTWQSRITSGPRGQGCEINLRLIEEPGWPCGKLARSLQLNRLMNRFVVLGPEEVDHNLLRENRRAAVGDRYPYAVQYVITVSLKKDLYTIRRNPRQKATDL